MTERKRFLYSLARYAVMRGVPGSDLLPGSVGVDILRCQWLNRDPVAERVSVGNGLFLHLLQNSVEIVHNCAGV